MQFLLKLLFEAFQFWSDHKDTVRLICIIFKIVLMIRFCLVKGSIWFDFSNDRRSPYTSALKLKFLFFSDLLLVRCMIENDRAILRTDIIALTV